MRLFALCLLFTAACQKEAAPPPPAISPAAKPLLATAATADAGKNAWTLAQEACVDAWLKAHGQDAYGSPQGTMYMGGTPLADEATGQHLTRQAFLATHRPEALQSCGALP